LRDEVGAEGGEAIRRLVVDLTRYMELAREMPTGELLYQFLVDSGWLARMSKAATARDEAEVQNISKFFRRVQDASKTLRYDNVREFVNHLDALIDAGEDPAVAEAEVAPPAEATDEMLAPIPPEQELVISHKQVDDYQTCPLKYRYVNVLRVPILRHHTVVYGATIHRVVEYYLLRRTAGNYTSLEDLLA